MKFKDHTDPSEEAPGYPGGGEGCEEASRALGPSEYMKSRRGGFRAQQTNLLPPDPITTAHHASGNITVTGEPQSSKLLRSNGLPTPAGWVL